MARTITFPEAVKRAVKSYYEDDNFDSYEKTTKKPLKYKHDVFDEVQSSYKRRNKRLKKKGDVAETDTNTEVEDSDNDGV